MVVAPIAAKKALNCDLIFSDPQSEFLICSLRLSNSRPIMLVCVYRPPNGDSKLFKSIDSKLKELKLLQNSEHPIIMAGDFNLPSVNWDAKLVESNPIYGSTVNRAALQLSLKYGLAQVVNKPTRVVSNNILDLIFVRPDSSFANLVVEQGISDHEIVVGQFKLACLNTENNNKDKFFRNYKKAPVHTIAEFLELEFPKFSSLYSDKVPVEVLFDKFLGIVNHIQDNLIPTSKIKIKNPNNPIWYNSEVIRLQKELKFAFKFRNKSPSHKRRFDLALQKVSEAKQGAEIKFFENLNLNINPAKSWKTVNKFLNKSTSIPGIKDNDGNITFDPFTKATLINSHFSKVFSSGSLQAAELESNHVSSLLSLGGFSFSVVQIASSIQSFKSTAPGPDGISIKTLKLLPNHFASYLYLIFNSSLSTSKIPDAWKKANITPVPKPGDKSEPDNYRPISITCCCCKILESLIASYIHKYLDIENILSPAQHGFRPGYSCETQLNGFWADVVNSINSGIQVDAILLDFAKAFDKVSHSRLLTKMHAIGIENQLVNWTKAFLTDRTQRVSVDGVLSGEVCITSGVPQGSVLGPLLFIIFINDLAQKIDIPLRLFADDCIIYRPIKSVNDVAILQKCLQMIFAWCIENGMVLNIKKCLCITFSIKTQFIIAIYLLGDIILSRVTSCKYLGINFNSNSSWDEHMGIIFNKAHSSLLAIQRSFKNCTSKTKELLYFSLVRSLLEYASTLWDPHISSKATFLEKIQRRAARFVLNRYGITDSVTDMLKQLNWESLDNRRTVNRLCCFYKVYFEISGWKGLNKFLKPPTFIGRGHEFKVFLNQSKSNIYLHSFIQFTSAEWNNLPLEIFADGTAAPGLSQFKSSIQSFVAAKV